MSLPTGPTLMRDAALTPAAILRAEYLYVSETAYQAVQDRNRSVMLHLLLLLGLIVASAGLFLRIINHGGAAYIQPLALVVALVLGTLATIFFLLVVRLRTAFDDSMAYLRALNTEGARIPGVSATDFALAVRYRRKTMLDTKSISGTTLALIAAFALVASLCLAAAILIADELLLPGNTGKLLDLPHDAMIYRIAGGAAALALVLHLGYYAFTVWSHRPRTS
ncbi:MAG TPA: hypothetical protein VLJ14_01030 [Ktedonobacterales bacterium]|nr:hypothetical protein [Ktedonobacterales bacterium]